MDRPQTQYIDFECLHKTWRAFRFKARRTAYKGPWRYWHTVTGPDGFTYSDNCQTFEAWHDLYKSSGYRIY